MRIEIRCGRCGKTHPDLEYEQLSGEQRGVYWATCPNTDEPILLQISQVNARDLTVNPVGPTEFK